MRRFSHKINQISALTGFAAVRRTGLHHAAVAVRQVHREKMDLACVTGNHRQRLTEVDLRVPRIVA